MLQWYPWCVTSYVVSALWEHTKRSLNWKWSPMTTTRNLKKFLCVFFMCHVWKGTIFFSKASQLSLVGFLYLTFLAHQKPLSHFAHPVGLLFQMAAARDTYLQCTYVYMYLFTLLGLQNLGVFFLWPEPDGQLRVRSTPVYIVYNIKIGSVCVLSWVGVCGWVYVPCGACTFLTAATQCSLPRPQSYQQLTTTIILEGKNQHSYQ